MYKSNYYGSNFYASGYYGPRDEDVVEPEVPDRGFAGGGRGSALSGKQRRLMKQIVQEDEVVLAFLSAYFVTVH